METPDPEDVREWLLSYQGSVIAAMKGVDKSSAFGFDQWERPDGGGGLGDGGARDEQGGGDQDR